MDYPKPASFHTLDEFRAHLERLIPNWRSAAETLAKRPEPYCLQ